MHDKSISVCTSNCRQIKFKTGGDLTLRTVTSGDIVLDSAGVINLASATMGGSTVLHDNYFVIEIGGVTKRVMCGSPPI